ncbi:hypothetical protein ABBQ38_011981 [Trebouxia sp. C0009 RCD-2024]
MVLSNLLQKASRVCCHSFNSGLHSRSAMSLAISSALFIVLSMPSPYGSTLMRKGALDSFLYMPEPVTSPALGISSWLTSVHISSSGDHTAGKSHSASG